MIIDSSISNNFFGRENLLEVLYGTAANTKNGGAGSVLLSGKRGFGKTKLLANLYHNVFQRKEGVVPFFYTANASLATPESFADDYLGRFIAQYLVFLGKDPELLSELYSFKELKEAAREFGARWVADVINDYIESKNEGSGAKIVYKAVSAPHRSYQRTGVPVVVMIDDFHRIRKFCEPGVSIHSGFWKFFEGAIRSMKVPHIFSGVPHEMEKVYFEDPLISEQLEIVDLPGLDEDDSIRLFRAASEMYGLKVELEPEDVIARFDGNPLYIINCLQAARHAGRVITKDIFERIYNNEVTLGKTYRYWIYLLKKYVRPLDLRKPALGFLNSLCDDNNDDEPSFSLHSELSDQDVLERITELLDDSGSIETGFSRSAPSDEVLKDVVKGLYAREVRHEAPDKVSELIVGDEGGSGEETGHEKESDVSSYVITIPSEPQAGLVAIKSFEEIARRYEVPVSVIGKLQLAMADLFSNVLAVGASGKICTFEVKSTESALVVEITTPDKDFVITEMDSSRIGAYIDELKVEGIDTGTVITLVQEISG